MNEFEVQRFDHLILEVENFNENFFGIETFGWEFELSLMSFF